MIDLLINEGSRRLEGSIKLSLVWNALPPNEIEIEEVIPVDWVSFNAERFSLNKWGAEDLIFAD